jgi:surface protein
MEENKLNFDGRVVTKARKGEQVVPRIYLGTDIVFRDYSHYDTYMVYNGTGNSTLFFNPMDGGSGVYSINGVRTQTTSYKQGTELGLIGLKPTRLNTTTQQPYDYSDWSIKKFSVPLETTDFTLMCVGFPVDSNLEYLRTDNATNFTHMFRDCEMESMNLSHFITDNVTSMYCTFQYCENLTELDVSTWNTSNVKNMQSMFAYCYSLKELNLTSFDTSSVTVNTSTMFSGVSDCTIYISDKWTLGTESNFGGGTNLTFIRV